MGGDRLLYIKKRKGKHMEKAANLKTVLLTVVGGVGSIVANLCGGWGEDLTTLLLFMCIDYITGLLIAAIWKRSGKSRNGALSSYCAWKGLVRKGASLLVVVVAHRLDLMIGADYIRTAVIIAFCGNEVISIVENMGIMGIPLPAVITKSIDILKNKAEEN